MRFHPIADIFPLLQGEEYETLKADIRANGLLESIWLHPDGSIVDGRNRWRACDELGVEPHYRTWDGNGSLVSFVVSLNLHRRHLTSSQRAAIAVDVLPMLEAEAKERQGARTDLVEIIPQSQTSFIGESNNFPEIIPESGKARDQAAEIMGTNGRYVSDAKRIKESAPAVFEQVLSGELTIPQAKQQIARQRTPEPATQPPIPEQKYRCIVIDPPWPIKKIEREERPNQGVELDYPTMTLDEIAALPVNRLAYDEGCHLYLWVTQKYLPFGLRLVEQWGFKYQCLMTWRKNVGFTPYSWMYDTEHVIFARRGNLQLKQLGLRLSFDAPVTNHSAKPDIFYSERVILASPEPRLEMFARKEREGFEVWGNEV